MYGAVEEIPNVGVFMVLRNPIPKRSMRKHGAAIENRATVFCAGSPSKLRAALPYADVTLTPSASSSARKVLTSMLPWP